MLKLKGKSLLLSAMVAAMAVPAVAGAAPIDTKETEVKNESGVQLEINIDQLGIKADEAFQLDLNTLEVTSNEAVKTDINLNLDGLGIKADQEFQLDLSLLEAKDGEASKTDTKLSENPITIDMKKEGLQEDQAFEYHVKSSTVVKK